MSVYGVTAKQAAVIDRTIADVAALRRRNPLTQRPGDSAFIPCLCIFESGNPGGPTQDCTFTYTVKDIGGFQTFLTGATPVKRRPQHVRMAMPTAETVGSMYVSPPTATEPAKLKLWDANEFPDFAPCSTPLKGGVPR